MYVQFLGATQEVTGSCHLIDLGDYRILLDCGLIQGNRKDEERNRQPFPFDPTSIDAVVLSHAHIDHSGRIPQLIKSGFTGPVYTQRASRDLCRIMLKDAAYLNERDAEWENRKRERKHLSLIEPLYTAADVQHAMGQFRGIKYNVKKRILPGITIRLSDAGHILGSSIVEVWLEEKGVQRKIVFSGDLGHNGAPILRDVTKIDKADLVIMESTYGDRLHRTLSETEQEIVEVQKEASGAGGNILIPAFAVGRTQELLFLFGKYYHEWNLHRWQVFLDSPMAIQATEVYARHSELYDEETSALWKRHQQHSLLPNFHFSRTANQSMALNKIRAGAIIIAGSGMCNGGRIKHHFKHNIWRNDCHVIISGFQAKGTLGRQLVDGARHIRLWGETINVSAKIHTIGGLSAHADQNGLLDWYRGFNNKPPVVLVHGEPEAMAKLQTRLQAEGTAPIRTAQGGEKLDLINYNKC